MTPESTLWDTVIVGGGPAGLSAAIHLAWHNRSVLVLDRRTGPLFFTLEKLMNVPGMPEVTGVELQKRLLAQAKELGAEHQRASVKSASGAKGGFLLQGEKGEEWRCRTVLLATGVARYHPTVDGDHTPCFAYAGKGNMFYCPDCEAPEIAGKDTIVIGAGPPGGAAALALGLSRYSDRLRVLLTTEGEVPAALATRLEGKGIAALRGKIASLDGKRGHLDALVLEDGTRLAADAFFVSSPAYGRTDLAQQLGVEMATTGNHAEAKSQRGDTNVPGVYVAGDLRPMSQQVAIAMGTGNIVALLIDQTLRRADIA